jgi:hypothetical protein
LYAPTAALTQTIVMADAAKAHQMVSRPTV